MNIIRSKKENNIASKTVWRCCLLVMIVMLGTNYSSAQREGSREETGSKARVIGLASFSVQVLDLEGTVKLYREILGFKLSDKDVLNSSVHEGMLVLKVNTDDLTVSLSPTAKEYIDTIGPIGNTNHNHFMLTVNDIGPIGDKLKEEGYELENENYARDKYTFFTGPNGEIIGLSAWD